MELTLAAYADVWLATRRTRGRPLAPRTVALYRWQLDREIGPGLGAVPLAALTRAQVRAWYDERSGPAGPGRLTTAKCYRLLRAICATAVEEGLLPATPCTLRGAGDEWSPERPVLTVPQVLALAGAVPPRHRALVLLGAFCCLRFGELSALRRPQVQLGDAGEPTVVAVVATAGQASGHGRVVGPPKSAAGRRRLTVPAAVVPDVRTHLARWAAPEPDGLVFVGPRGGALHNNHFGVAVWRPALAEVGLQGVRFHDLRHTGNTLAAATGASLADLMARMGHASTEAALRYQHATRVADTALASALSDLVEQARPA